MRKLIWSGLIALTIPAQALGEDNLGALLFMSLEDLSKVKVTVPAALTKLTSYETPASTTVITAADIAITPARNLLDLIETYVPGAQWMNHSEGPVLQVRGNMASRAYKYMLRVNGRVLNNKGHYGAKSELELWDLGDIARIEIIQGAGSVTYGSGAVAGIINIITHTGKSAKGWQTSSHYVSDYNAVGASARYGARTNHYTLLAYASITRTRGLEAPHYLGSNGNTPGFIGQDIKTDTRPLDYFGDYNNRPQIKAHVDTTLGDKWRMWLRYTRQGSNWSSNETKSNFGGTLLNQQGVRERHWTAALDYSDELSEAVSLHASFSADGSDVERRKDNVRVLGRHHILNKKTDFSETEIQLRGVMNWQAHEGLEIAFGAEFSQDYFGPGWGDHPKDMRLGDGGIIVNSPASNAILSGNGGSADKDGLAIFAGNGWDTSTISVFSEVNLAITPRLTGLVSARVDKNTYSDALFSPRLALIAEVAEGHHVKAIVQKARRMNTAGQLFIQHNSGKDHVSEDLTTLELIYSAHADNNLSWSMTGFWNTLDVIGLNADENITSHLGDLDTWGFEPEILYKTRFGKFGLNYSCVKQKDWTLEQGVFRSGVSYSDYNLPLQDTSGVLSSQGNDLNNWANHALKAFGTASISDRLTLHVDGRFLWGYNGAKDGLEGLRAAVSGQPEEAAVRAALQEIENQGVYDPQFRLNASLSFEPRQNLFIRVLVQNLAASNDAKRYAFDTGIGKASPHRVRFIEEPRTFAVKLDYQF